MRLLVFLMLLAGVGLATSCSHTTAPTGGCDTCSSVSRPADTTSHDFTWNEYSIPTENNMTGVWVFGPQDIYALNDRIYHYNGSSWQPVVFSGARGSLDGLSGNSIFGLPGQLWLTYGGIVTRCDLTNHDYTEYRFSDTSIHFLHALWGASSSDLYAVGDAGTILHYDGANWSVFPKVTTENLYSISGTSSKNVWAAGYTSSNHTALLHFDGTSWSVDPLSQRPTGQTGGCVSVLCTDSAGQANTFVSGSLVYRANANNPGWSILDSANIPNRFPDGGYAGVALAGTQPNDLLGVGAWGEVMHWSGKSWKRYEEFFEPGNPSFQTGGVCYRNGTAAVVGFKNGSSWILVGQRK